MDVNEELKFLGKFTKKIRGRWWGSVAEGIRWGGGSVAEGVRWGGSGWWGGGQGGCERNVGGRG